MKIFLIVVAILLLPSFAVASYLGINWKRIVRDKRKYGYTAQSFGYRRCNRCTLKGTMFCRGFDCLTSSRHPGFKRMPRKVKHG